MFNRKRLRLLAYWRRWRAQEGPKPLRDLLQRADPAAPWLKRVNWLLGLADWLHYEPAGMRSGERVRQLIKTRRLRLLLNEIERHPAMYTAAVETLRSIMKDADGLELFCATGLPREPALLSEVVEQVMAKLLPKSLVDRDLDSLFGAVFPAPGHADWMEHIDPATLARMRDLALAGEVPARFRRNAEDALIYLARVVSAIGMHPDVRARLPFTSLRVTPFLKLEDAVRALVMAPQPEATEARAASLAEARAALFQTRAAILEAYRHLSHHGVSVFLVYRLQRMRALTERMDALLTLLFPRVHESEHAARFLADLIRARHQRTSVRALLRRNTALLARKMVEHNAEHGDHYIARNRGEYIGMFRAALGGGVITAFTTWLKFVIVGFGLAKFVEGLVASMNYALSFLVI
jgi:site-specific recombinase